MKRIFLKVCSKLKILGYFNVEVKLKQGIKAPVMGGLGYDNILGTEKWMSSLLRGLLQRSGGCFVDVGVNIGQTLIKVKSIDRDIEYIGFEPNPICVFYAEKLISSNKFPNAKIIPAGISNTNEIVTLKYFSTDLTDSSASIIDNFRPNSPVLGEKAIAVLNSDKIRIDSKITLIKIDVEGAELMVIEGLKSFLSRDRPAIIIEILPVYEAKNQERLSRQNAIMKIMNDLNYTILRVIKNQDNTLKGVVRIEDFGIHSDIALSDYLLIPGESMEEVLNRINNG
jgi:FkbM family methyltransferase